MTSDEVDYPPVVRMTDIIDAATDLQFAYERFNKVRGEVFDDLLNAQNREEKDEKEVLTAGDLYNYMEYLEDHGCIEIWDDREEWEK